MKPIEFDALAAGSAAQTRSDCTVVGVYESQELSEAATQIDRASKNRLKALLKDGDFAGKAGDTLFLHALPGVASERVLLVGLGARKRYNAKTYRRAVSAAVQALSRTGTRHATVWLAQEEAEDLTPYYAGRFLAETAEHTLYRIPDLKSGKKPPLPALRKLTLVINERGARKEAELGLNDGAGIAVGVKLARDLGNLPPNVCTPKYLARTAEELAKRHRSIKTRVLDEPAIEKLKMGSFLSVTHGSEEPPRLMVLEYRGGSNKDAPIALVGKGITFDTGGISLKDPAAMDEMKFDMCGAATVLGVFDAAAALELPVNLVGVIPACENMPSGKATKPGDIVTSMSGQTIEILNTDAEGRLILADALTYSRQFKPQIVIDIATLTGACVIALGAHYCGLMSNDDTLATELASAGKRSGDRAWHLPIGEDYVEQLKSNFADLANVAGREGGALTAGSFLSKFTEGLRWAHLDIAGVAWLSGAQKGGTGRPVPLLLDFLLQHSRA